MLKRLLSTTVAVMILLHASAQNPPKRELRGAWIATYLGIDWPDRRQTAETQKNALLSILDHHKATGLNVLYIQVRSQCDAMYESAIEPWSADITGTQGKNPGYDPMQFAIEACHKRGIEFHAWINPYRAVGNVNNLPGFAPNHVAKQQPGWLMSTGLVRTLNPGIPGVRDYINMVISDIVTRYNIDGIHFDDYFYPNPGMTNAQDDAAFAADPRGFTLRADWRRDNVNMLIKRVNETIQQIKPWVKFGVSPSGIYRNSTNPEIGSATAGLEHYTTLYADSRKWLKEGWVDYLAPQVYWYIGQPGANYAVIVPWWNQQAAGRHIYIGMAGYKVNDPLQGVHWANPSQIPNEVRLNRHPAHANVYGQSIYNTSSLRSNTRLGFRDSLRLFFYNNPALLPAMPWRDNTPPAPASLLTAVKYSNDSVVLKWNKPAATENEFDRVLQFLIYRSEKENIDYSDANNMLLITNTDVNTFTDKNIVPGTTYYYAVTALDRFHNESVSSNKTDNIPPAISCPGDQQLYVDNSCAVIVPDFTTLVQVNDDIPPADPLVLSQLPAAGTVISGTGNFTVTISAADAGGNKAGCSFNVAVADTIKPVITAISTDPSSLWPVNHKLRNVKVNYDVTDNCGPVTSVLTVSSNEAVDSTGDGNTGNDWIVTDDHRVQLRAERSGAAEGRVYTITITSTDASGNVSMASINVNVPHDHREEIITERNEGSRKPVLISSQPVMSNLSVRVANNPSNTTFTLYTTAQSANTMQLRVTDLLNRVIERRTNMPSNGIIQLGKHYKPGIYQVELIQGKQRIIIKLVKQQ